jgi:hypothetical protein
MKNITNKLCKHPKYKIAKILFYTDFSENIRMWKAELNLLMDFQLSFAKSNIQQNLLKYSTMWDILHSEINRLTYAKINKLKNKAISSTWPSYYIYVFQKRLCNGKPVTQTKRGVDFYPISHSC